MISTEYVTITPDMAREMLKTNTKNRKVRQGMVERFARDMVNGDWTVTHQGIAFDSEGTLIDGQHRLMAICKANVPITMMVSRGFEPNTIKMIDIGGVRSLRDIINSISDENWERATYTQAVARFIMVEMMRVVRGTPTSAEVIWFMNEYAPAMKFAYGMATQYNRARSAAMVTMCVAASIAKVPIKHICAFMDIMNYNKIPSNGTAYNIKAALDLKDQLKMSHLGHREAEAKIQRAFYMFYENKKRLPADFGNKIIYPITKQGLKEFCKTIAQQAFDAVCAVAGQ